MSRSLSNISHGRETMNWLNNAMRARVGWAQNGHFYWIENYFYGHFFSPPFQSSQQIECDINNKSETLSKRLSTVIRQLYCSIWRALEPSLWYSLKGRARLQMIKAIRALKSSVFIQNFCFIYMMYCFYDGRTFCVGKEGADFCATK